MQPTVLAFAGRIASGKSTISEAVAQALGWPRVGFGDFVRRAARERGVEPSRENLQALGASFIEAGIRPFCRSVLDQVAWRPSGCLIIDGVRHAEVLVVLRDLVRPSTLRLAYIAVGKGERRRRISGRDPTDAEAQRRVEAHATESQVGSTMMGLADWVLDGGRPVGAIAEEVIRLLEGDVEPPESVQVRGPL